MNTTTKLGMTLAALMLAAGPLTAAQAATQPVRNIVLVR